MHSVSTQGTTRPNAALAGRIAAHALPVLVLAQAVMAGRSERLFGRWSIVAHGIVSDRVCRSS